MLSPTRHAVSAKRFFRKALRGRHTTPPRVINVDKNPSYSKAVSKLRKKGTSPPEWELRPIKYIGTKILSSFGVTETKVRSAVEEELRPRRT